jgi:CspA family cold shock protein
MAMNGTIKRMVSDKGFGFVAADDGNEYFFHQSACTSTPFDSMREGQAVTFERGQGPKGPRAENEACVVRTRGGGASAGQPVCGPSAEATGRFNRGCPALTAPGGLCRLRPIVKREFGRLGVDRGQPKSGGRPTEQQADPCAPRITPRAAGDEMVTTCWPERELSSTRPGHSSP